MTFSNPVVGGENGELIRRSIQSPDYVAGVSGWTINRDGSAEFNNVTIRFDLATGSIVVGPSTGPQVVIKVTTDGGLIEFPTNETYEKISDPPSIFSDSLDASQRIQLKLTSGITDGNNSEAYVNLTSGEVTTGLNGIAHIGVTGALDFSEVEITEDYIYLNAAESRTGTELLVSTNTTDSNYPIRIVGGKVRTTTLNTTLSTASDTEVVDADVTSVYLVSGVAYRVDVQIATRSSAGTGAAGTQQLEWKLWETSVGGTQLGASIQKYKDGVGSASSIETYTFLFEYTGTTGSKTLKLSGRHLLGTDTVQAQLNTRYFMLVERIGDPAMITNL